MKNYFIKFYRILLISCPFPVVTKLEKYKMLQESNGTVLVFNVYKQEGIHPEVIIGLEWCFSPEFVDEKELIHQNLLTTKPKGTGALPKLKFKTSKLKEAGR